MDGSLIGVAKWAIYWNYEGREFETPKRVVYRDDQPKGRKSTTQDSSTHRGALLTKHLIASGYRQLR